MEKFNIHFEGGGYYKVRKTFEIEAASQKEAVEKARQMYADDEIDLKEARYSHEMEDYDFY